MPQIEMIQCLRGELVHSNIDETDLNRFLGALVQVIPD
jgi:hypothetical protein